MMSFPWSDSEIGSIEAFLLVAARTPGLRPGRDSRRAPTKIQGDSCLPRRPRRNRVDMLITAANGTAESGAIHQLYLQVTSMLIQIADINSVIRAADMQ
jgi:hypothetical protein